MNKENKKLLEELSEELSSEESELLDNIENDELLDVENLDVDSEVFNNDFNINVGDLSRKELKEQRGVKQEANGRTLTIKEVNILPPKTFSVNENGAKNVVTPKVTKKGKEYYDTKLRIRFEEDNLVEYYPSIRVWVNNGKLSSVVALDSSRYDGSYTSNTKVAQFVRLALQKMSSERNDSVPLFDIVEETVNEKLVLSVRKDDLDVYYKFSESVSDKELLDWLPGKKVLIKTSKGNYEGSEWFRNDIEKFV